MAVWVSVLNSDGVIEGEGGVRLGTCVAVTVGAFVDCGVSVCFAGRVPQAARVKASRAIIICVFMVCLLLQRIGREIVFFRMPRKHHNPMRSNLADGIWRNGNLIWPSCGDVAKSMVMRTNYKSVRSALLKIL